MFVCRGPLLEGEREKKKEKGDWLNQKLHRRRHTQTDAQSNFKCRQTIQLEYIHEGREGAMLHPLLTPGAGDRFEPRIAKIAFNDRS